MITIGNTSAGLNPSAQQQEQLQINTENRREVGENQRQQQENRTTDLRAEQQTQRIETEQRTNATRGQQILENNLDETQRRQENARANRQNEQAQAENSRAANAREDNELSPTRQSLARLQTLNDEQANAQTPAARQTSLREFNTIANRLENDNSNRPEFQRENFNPDNPEQTREAIQRADEVQAREEQENNERDIQRTEATTTQALETQDNARRRVLGPQEPAPASQREQSFIDSREERPQSPEQQQRDNPFGNISS